MADEETTTQDLSQLQKEINELKRQNEMLKKKRFVLNQSKKSLDQQKPPILQKKQSKMVLNIDQSAEKQTPQRTQRKEALITATEQIARPRGNYVNLPKVLNISNNDYNGYKSNIRDLVEAYINTEETWEKQDKRTILKLVEKFKENNLLFPKTVGDWAIKEMFRRSINNKRGHQQKKQKAGVQNKKNKAVAVARSNKMVGRGETAVRNRNEVVASSSKTNLFSDSVADDTVDSMDDDDTSCDDKNEEEDKEEDEERKGDKSKNKKDPQIQDQRKSGRISKQPRQNYK